MRRRLLVSFPIAVLLVVALLGSASTFVSALERMGEPSLHPPGNAPSFELRPSATTCDVLRREIHALSHAVSPCELSPECQGSPLLCPRALDRRIEQEYERLRDALHAQCGLPRSLLDFAWEAGEQVDVAEGCEVVHDGWEAAARGEARPSTYSF